MIRKRKRINSILLCVAILLGIAAVYSTVNRFSKPSYSTKGSTTERCIDSTDTKKPSPEQANEDYKDQTKTLKQKEENEITENAGMDYSNGGKYSETSKHTIETRTLRETEIRNFTKDHPFFKEAKKILGGNLEENDSASRRVILNYCEHLRMAYPTKDIDFLRQVFSDNALIIVGNSIRKSGSTDVAATTDKVRYSIHSKASYLKKLETIFSSNSRIDVAFSDFNIKRHPTMEGIYGVTLRQKYKSDRYSDDGYLFLLWDFRNPSMPLIHVRTWQPEEYLASGKEKIELSDFNLD